MKQLLAFLTMLLVGCEFPGTHTGNPPTTGSGHSPSPGSQPTNGSAPNVFELACERLETCTEANYESCIDSTTRSSEFIKAMGFDDSRYPSGEDIDWEDAAINQVALSTCKSALSSLSCADPVISKSYDDQSLEPFSQTHHLLEADLSCGDIAAD